MILSLVVVTAFLVLSGPYRGYFELLTRLEYMAYDARLNLYMPGGVDDRIVIIDIDEKSLAAEGRWPWGRDKTARLIDVLFEDYGVGLLGFDMVFPEPDNSSGILVLEELAREELKNLTGFSEQLERLRPRLDRDAIFARSLAKYPVVLGFYFSTIPNLAVGKLPPPAFVKAQFEGRDIPFMSGPGFGANLAQLQDAASGAGHITPAVDADGVIRRIPLLHEYDGKYYEALALTIARLALNAKSLMLGFPEQAKPGSNYQGMEWIDVGNRRVSVDQEVRALVPYRGKQGSFPYVSATDVLNAKVSRSRLEGRIALVGTSAPGLQDIRSTPVQEKYPGVEVHANLIAGILDGTIMHDPMYTLGADFLIVALFGVILAIALPLLRPIVTTIASAGAMVVFLVANLWAWNDNLLLSVVPGTLMIASLYLLNMSYGFFIESRGRRQLAELFGYYIPPQLVDEMSLDPAHYSMDARSREMTVLFTDVRGFTTISEGLEPAELSALMNEFLTPITAVIHRHRGTIDKYMGDAVMCFWGAPVPDPDHARRCVECAMEIVAAVAALGPRFIERGWPAISIGVGINTGDMNVGDMGSEFRRAYTVLGDAVNLGSRLEGLTKNYGVHIIVSESTRAVVPGIRFRELDKIRVKGKHEPVTIFEPLGRKEALGDEVRTELRLYAQALSLYRSQSWDSAEIQFVNLKNTYPYRAVLFELFIERIAQFRRNSPPPDWDGTFTFETK
ncbi:MAG: CHASE2 domain-containing protein [Gammaproteobacteria bacterium]|nr:CHASE2 domain-containing protein [Gammaproteobacteria bacterium]